jgi:energy-coupling factor transporter transmembrane protein EcfT
MESLLGSIDSQLVVLVAAVAIVVLLAQLALRVLKVGLGPIVWMVAIVALLNYGLGVSPAELWFEIGRLPQTLMRLVQNLGG